MNKFIFPIIYIILFLFVAVTEVSANSNVINNVLIQSNIYLKQAGLVQEKYSGIARDIVNTKVAPDDLIGENAAAAKKKAEKKLKSAESKKEKAMKIKEFADDAKEKKEALTARYQELNALAAEKMAAAQKAIGEGQSIFNEYKTKAQDGINKANELKDKASEAKDKVDELKGKEEQSNENMETVSEDEDFGDKGIVSDAEENNVDASSDTVVTQDTLPVDGFLQKSKNTELQAYPVVQPKINSPEVVIKENSTVVQEIPSTYVSNQADAIVSAASMADSTIDETSVPLSAEGIASVSDINSPDVSVDDVMSAAAQGITLKSPSATAKTDMSLSEQLLQASNKTVSKVNTKTDKLSDIGIIGKARDKFKNLIRFDENTSSENVLSADTVKKEQINENRL